MDISEEVLIKLAKQSEAAHNYRDAIVYIRKIAQSEKRDEWLGDLYYRLGVQECAHDSWGDAGGSLTMAQELNPSSVKRELAHQRRLLIKKVAASGVVNEWRKMGRSCASCKSTPSLYNCAICPQFGGGVKPSQFTSQDMLKPQIDELLVPAAYRSNYDKEKANPFSKLIRLAKNGQGTKSCGIMGHMLAEYINQKTDLRARVDLIIPIPTSSDRSKLRGYSIPTLLAEAISTQLCLPSFSGILTLRHDTQETRGLPRQAKEAILSGAFQVTKPEMIKGLNILIVDDIMTTGTTLRCAAAAVRECMPLDIFAVVLAHTEQSWSW